MLGVAALRVRQALVQIDSTDDAVAAPVAAALGLRRLERVDSRVVVAAADLVARVVDCRCGLVVGVSEGRARSAKEQPRGNRQRADYSPVSVF